MNHSLAPIYELNDECVLLCQRLVACLKDERVSLIHLKMDEIQLATQRKEGLITLLAHKKQLLRGLVQTIYGNIQLGELDGHLSEPDRSNWKDHYQNWCNAWKEVHDLCKRNQNFTRHSLRNLGNLVENMRRLMGENNLYCAKGTTVDPSSPGRVVEAQY